MFRSGWLQCLLLTLGVPAALAAPWHWPGEFTPESSKDLIALHEEILAPRLEGVAGVPVQDVHWRDDFFDLHLQSGIVFQEPPVQGYPAGAFFVGKATMSFTPTARKARQDLEHWFGEEKIAAQPVTHAYFFTLRAATLAAQLGAAGQGPASFDAREIYEESKLAMRQLGTALVHAFLNRAGRSKDTAYILLADQAIRTDGSERAYLLYSIDRDVESEVRLAVIGHKEVVYKVPERYYFHPLVACHSDSRRFAPHGRVSQYSTRLKVGAGANTSEEDTTISFTPTDGVSALRLELTPRMKVSSVSGADGGELPFVQWKYRPGDPDYDPNVVVALPAPLNAGAVHEIRVRSSGSLFEPWFNLHWLVDEDAWHPLMDDPQGALYEMWFTVPKNQLALGAGAVVEDGVVGRERRYHFRTQRPHKRSTIYFGDFSSRAGKADETQIEVYVDRQSIQEAKNHQFVLDEVSNAVKVYNRIFQPLETPILRVASTPTEHGRGFEGVILLGGGFGGSSPADLFRAHEVAHQWWGNVVQPRDWPEDRWLSESFAELSAMEYYQVRYENYAKTREQIYANWVNPILKSPKLTRTDLLGRKSEDRASEMHPVIDGGNNVYTKGPEVLHMLRYLFRVQKGSDKEFWALMRAFLDKYRYQQASTADFTALAEAQLGMKLGWFWDQWLYGGDIPVVRWSHTLEEREGKWLLSVQARQEETNFTLLIPVYAHFGGERAATKPMLIQGASGQTQMLLPEKPARVSLNDFYEALVRIKD